MSNLTLRIEDGSIITDLEFAFSQIIGSSAEDLMVQSAEVCKYFNIPIDAYGLNKVSETIKGVSYIPLVCVLSEFDPASWVLTWTEIPNDPSSFEVTANPLRLKAV